MPSSLSLLPPAQSDVPPPFFPQLNFDLDRGVFPVVIQAMVDEGDGERPFFFILPSSMWTLQEESTSCLSHQEGVYVKVIKDVGALSAGLGLWGSSN